MRTINIHEATAYASENNAFITRKIWSRVITSNPVRTAIKLQPTNTPSGCFVYDGVTNNIRSGWQPRAEDLLAEDFEKWVFDEVLPSIRKHGAYINPAMAQKQALQEKRLQIMEMNAKTRQAKQMMQLWNAAGVKPQDQALALNGYYEGLELPRTVFAETTTALLDKTTIAKHLGICSKSGNPHAHAVGAIIQKLSLTDEEQTLTPYSRNGHDGEDVQYTPSVERKVFDWLEQNHYPPKVDAGNKCYSVMYKGKEV